jgi:hypothetical protein
MDGWKGCRNPGEQQLPYEEHYLTTKDGVIIHCWFIPQGNTVPTHHWLASSHELFCFV